MKLGCCMISTCQKYLAILLTFICVIVLYPQSTYATEAISQRETIRVGFFEKIISAMAPLKGVVKTDRYNKL